MSVDPKAAKSELQKAGVEIYRARSDEIQIAERIRLHLMDSGVRLVFGPPMRVAFTVRSQKSDFPDASGEELITRARGQVGPEAARRGYVEVRAESVDVRDPMDATRILDVWHEVTYEKPVPALAEALEEVRWILSVDRFLGRDA
jgi:hypothetical protein